MCLAIPGLLLERWIGDGDLAWGKVAFGSVRRKEDVVDNPAQAIADFVREVHIALLSKMDLDASDHERRNNQRFIVQVEHNIEEVAREKGLAERGDHAGSRHRLGFHRAQASRQSSDAGRFVASRLMAGRRPGRRAGST